jgi:hypothetical protein
MPRRMVRRCRAAFMGCPDARRLFRAAVVVIRVIYQPTRLGQDRPLMQDPVTLTLAAEHTACPASARWTPSRLDASASFSGLRCQGIAGDDVVDGGIFSISAERNQPHRMGRQKAGAHMTFPPDFKLDHRVPWLAPRGERRPRHVQLTHRNRAGVCDAISITALRR